MRMIIYAGLFVALFANSGAALSADKVYTFTIKGKNGMQFRASMEPKECLKKVNKVWLQRKSCTSSVEPILLNGPPLTLIGGEHIFDLIEGIREQAKAYGTAEYPIGKYAGVCVALLRKPEAAIWKCGPIGGSVEF